MERREILADLLLCDSVNLAVLPHAAAACAVVQDGDKLVFLRAGIFRAVQCRLVQNAALLGAYEPLRVRKFNAHTLCEFLCNDPGVLAVYDGCGHHVFEFAGEFVAILPYSRGVVFPVKLCIQNGFDLIGGRCPENNAFAVCPKPWHVARYLCLGGGAFFVGVVPGIRHPCLAVPVGVDGAAVFFEFPCNVCVNQPVASFKR